VCPWATFLRKVNTSACKSLKKFLTTVDGHSISAWKYNALLFLSAHQEGVAVNGWSQSLSSWVRDGKGLQLVSSEDPGKFQVGLKDVLLTFQRRNKFRKATLLKLLRFQSTKTLPPPRIPRRTRRSSHRRSVLRLRVQASTTPDRKESYARRRAMMVCMACSAVGSPGTESCLYWELFILEAVYTGSCLYWGLFILGAVYRESCL
jgi:hypothetical protein